MDTMALQKLRGRYNVGAMTEKKKESPFKLEPHEKEGMWYIIGVIVLIALIVILASLTHVVLHPH